MLLNDKTTVRVRMEGIDAPEKGMPYYKNAKQHLASLCFQKHVMLDVNDTDGNRLIAFSYLEDGTELSREMLKAGYAWHFKKYNNDADLDLLEKQARNSGLGLWADPNPMPPSRNRQLHRQGISTKDSFEINEYNH